MSEQDKKKDILLNIHHTFLLGKITGDLFHEINNMVGASIGFAQLAKMSMGEDDVNKLIDVVLNSTEKIKEISKSAQTYLSYSNNNGSLVDISDVLCHCVTLSRKSLIKRGIKISDCDKKLIAFQTDVRTLKHAILSFISFITENNEIGGTLDLKAEKINETQVKIEFFKDDLCVEKINEIIRDFDNLDFMENLENDCYMALYLIQKVLGASTEISKSTFSFIIDEIVSQ